MDSIARERERTRKRYSYTLPDYCCGQLRPDRLMLERRERRWIARHTLWGDGGVIPGRFNRSRYIPPLSFEAPQRVRRASQQCEHFFVPH